MPAPQEAFRSEDGGALNLADFQGRWLLVNLWATWCGPCVQEMPDLDLLQRELGGPDFQVVAISSDRAGFEVIRPFYESHGIEHLAAFWDEGGQVMWRFGAPGLPSSYLINPQGEVVAGLLGVADWAGQDALTFFRYYLSQRE